MSHDTSIIGEEGLLFFGKVSASISHELKNSLAIINESAGLLEDFTAMAAQGMPVAPERLQSVASKLRRQVRRSDEIINRMNRFAHTIDKPVDRIDLIELLKSVCDLAERIAAMRGVELEVAGAPNRIMVETAPFRLRNIIWLCIDFILRQDNSKGVLRLQAETTDTTATIRISPGTPLFDDTRLNAVLPGDHGKALLGDIGADLAMDHETQALVLTLPLIQAT
jgi:C4-dicarboxylate-specific signal transduction histidine kinase